MRVSTEKAGKLSLAAVALLALALRLQLAFTERGLYWPDEIFQSLEPAHRLVYGYGMVAWEFVDGARNWALPGLVAFFLKVAQLFGLSTPNGYLPFVYGAFALLSVGAGYGAFRLARAYGAGVWPAVCAAALFLLSAPALYFGHRAMSENASALPVALGLAFALRKRAPEETERRHLLLLVAGASLLGVATLLRMQNGVFCAGLVLTLLARRTWKPAGVALGALLVWAFLYGLLDKLTWGGFFHSAVKYLQFNAVEGRAAQWGTAPFVYYAKHLWQSQPGTTLVVVTLALCAARRAPGLLATALAFLALHAYVPHKELRFILPVLPVLAALAGIGLSVLSEKFERAQAAGIAATALACVFSLATYRGLTFGQLGQYLDQKPAASAYDDGGQINRLLLAASEQKDVCGLKIEVAHLAWTGGHTYLHQNVPLYMHYVDRSRPILNYVVTMQGYEGGGQTIARDGPLVLVKLRDRCAPDPGYSWRLP